MPRTDEELLDYLKKFKSTEATQTGRSDEELLRSVASLDQPVERLAVQEQDGQPYDPRLTPEENQAAWVVSKAKFPTIAAGVQASGARALSAAYRVGELLPEKFGGRRSREQADWFANYSTALTRSAEIAGEQGVVKRGATSALSNIVPMLAGAPGGVATMIGIGVADQMNLATTEGRNAGLKGAELSVYVGRQGMIEGTVTGLMSRYGLGGMERVLPGAFAAARNGIRQGINQTMKAGLKTAAKQTARTFGEEEVEEVTIAALQMWNDKYSGVDKSDWSLDQVARSFADVTSAVAWTTAGGAGPVHLAQNVTAGKQALIEQDVVTAAEQGKTPTRKQWKEWGLDPEQGKTAQGRAEGVQQAAAQLQQQYVPSESVAEETQQETAQEAVDVPPEQTVIQEQPPEGTVIESMQPGPEAAHPITSIKNEIVTQLREGRGEAAVPGVASETTEEWLNTAEQQIRNDPAFATRLVDELMVQPRTISDVDTAALQLHYRNLNNQFTTASDEFTAARQSNDPLAIKEAEAKAKFILGEVQKTEEAAKAAGREWGRAGIARQLEIRADYTPAALIRRASTTKGKLLSQSETDQINELGTKVTILQAELDRLNAARTDQDSDLAVEAAIKQAAPKKRFQKRIPSLKRVEAQKHVQEAWAEFKRTLGPPTEGLIGGESGALNVDAVAAGVKLAKAYADLGVTTFTEFLTSAKTFVGDVAGVTADTLRHSWKQAQKAGYIPPLDVDPDDAKSVAKIAKRLTRSLVENGITERDAVVDGVHAELQQVIPEITKRQVMDAISGYGKYAELTKGEVEAAIRDIKGQLQQVAKLEDMRQGQPPKKTGVERRTPSDVERRLIQQVNEAKRRGGFNVTDPETQLKSALDASKTAIRNRISDMEEEIHTGQRIVKQKTEVIPDKELVELRQKRDELQKVHDDLFPRQPLTQEQLAARTSKALDSAITQLESELKEGTLYPKKTTTRVSTPEIEAKRQQLEALRTHRQELRDIANPKKTPEERQLSAYKTRLNTRLADLQRRIAESDFTKIARKETTLDKEAANVKWQIKQEQDRYKALEERWQKDQLKGIAKAWDTAAEASNFSRAVMTSFDLSAIGRQAGPAAKAHPVKAAFALEESLKAFASKEGEFTSAEKLRNHPKAQLANAAKLAITVTEGQLTQQEEAYRGKWASKVPGVAGSERAYVTFLNTMRMGLFSDMVDSLGGTDNITLAEAKAIANAVNVFTGRGYFTGANAAAAQSLSTYFFSPRFVVSRFQLLLGQPLWHGTLRTRKLIAKEYARYLAGEAAFYSLLGLLGYLTAGDEESEQPVFEWNPLSPNFGKVRLGDTVIDPMAGLSQVTVLLGRLAFGETKKATGEVVPIRGEDVPFKGLTATDVISRFLRSKLAPIPGAAWNVLAGENMIGEKKNLFLEAGQLAVPLSFRDIYDTMQAKGFSRKLTLSLLVLLGIGAQNYQDATPEAFARKIAQHPQLRGYDKKERKHYDYSEEVDQIVREAKKRGLKASDLGQALVPYMQKEGNRPETINEAMARLYARFNASG